MSVSVGQLPDTPASARTAGLQLPSSAAPWIAGATVLAIGLFDPRVLNDGDTFLHLQAGAWMIDHGAVLYRDPFSYSLAGAPWVSHEWLAEVLLAGSYRLAGWSGALALAAAAAALSFFQLARHLGRWLRPAPTLLLVLLAFACVAPGLLVRPHILALPALEAWTAGLFIARSKGRPPSVWLLPVMCLWANLHGGFIIGLALVVPLALEAALEKPAVPVLVQWSGFLLAAISAALLTPHGITGLVFPFRLAAMPGLSGISEWQPTDFGAFPPLDLILLAGLYVALSRGARLPMVRLLIVLGLLQLALQHTRHQQLVGIIGPLLIAQPLSAALSVSPLAGDAGRWWRSVGIAVVAGLVTLRMLIPVVRTDHPSAPISAVAHLPPTLASEPVFNDYSFGGYLIFSHIRPFIDGRADMYGPAFLARYDAVTRPDLAAMKATFREYGVRWTILRPTSPAVALLDALPDWCRIYADRIAVIHTRCRPADHGD